VHVLLSMNKFHPLGNLVHYRPCILPLRLLRRGFLHKDDAFCGWKDRAPLVDIPNVIFEIHCTEFHVDKVKIRRVQHTMTEDRDNVFMPLYLTNFGDCPGLTLNIFCTYTSKWTEYLSSKLLIVFLIYYLYL
jgi:hypothetical protein